MIRPFLASGSDGDTIVEVLVVLAVLGLAFAISYATANKGLQQSQNAQEHSYALGLIDSQVEMLRSIAPTLSESVPAGFFNPYSHAAQAFCMTSPTQDVSFSSQGDPNPPSATATTDFTKYPSTCHYANGGADYYESAVYTGTPTNGYFEFTVRWPGLGNLGIQQEQINYKVGEIEFGRTTYLSLRNATGNVGRRFYDNTYSEETASGFGVYNPALIDSGDNYRGLA